MWILKSSPFDRNIKYFLFLQLNFKTRFMMVSHKHGDESLRSVKKELSWQKLADLFGSLFYDDLSLTRLHSIDGRVISD
jgi:hypothetical protein